MDGHLIIGEFILTLGAFLALLFVIHKFAWTPFNQMLEERQNKVQADWQAAEDAKKDAEDHQATIKEQLRQAHLQADQIIRKAHKESENMREEMLAETLKIIEALAFSLAKKISRTNIFLAPFSGNKDTKNWYFVFPGRMTFSCFSLWWK